MTDVTSEAPSLSGHALSSQVGPDSGVTSSASYFPALRVYMGISLALLVVMTVAHANPVLSMISAVAPLIVYHVYYLAPRARHGLGQSAVDSVYYFGFLVTLAALAASAVSLSLGGAKLEMSRVAFQFGLGLLATGYAVFARMHLTSLVSWVEEEEQEAVMNRIVIASRELATNVEMAASSYSRMVHEALARTESINETAWQIAEKQLLDVARAFDQQMREATAGAREALIEVRSLMNDAAFVNERQELSKCVRDTIEETTALASALRDLSTETRSVVQSTTDSGNAADALRGSIVHVRSELDGLAQSGGGLKQSVDQFARVYDSLASTTEDFGASFTAAKAHVAKTSPALQAMSEFAGQASAKFEGIVGAAESMMQASAGLSKAAGSTNELVHGLDLAAQTIPKLESACSSLIERLSGVSQQLDRLQTTSATLPASLDQTHEMTRELSGAVAQLKLAMQGAVVNTAELTRTATGQVQAFEQVQTLARGQGAVDHAVQQLEMLLQRLSAALDSLPGQIETSCGTLSGVMARAAADMETGLSRQGEVATLFSQRMVDAAQVVLDGTRKAAAA